MIRKMLTVASFGERYLTSAMIYVALGLILASVTPEASLLAQTTSCSSCPEDTFCCNGTCIQSDWACCQDGSFGPPASASGQQCACCNGCSSTTCSTPTTYQCAPAE
jgi:hypothetical protein